MEKVEMVREMMSKGIKREESLRQSGLTRNQFYYKVKGNRRGRLKTETTKWRDPQTMKIYEVDNEQVTREIVDIKLDPDHPNWYKLITNTMDILTIVRKSIFIAIEVYFFLKRSIISIKCQFPKSLIQNTLP